MTEFDANHASAIRHQASARVNGLPEAAQIEAEFDRIDALGPVAYTREVNEILKTAGLPAIRYREYRDDGDDADHVLDGVEDQVVDPWPTLDPAALHGLAGDVVRTIQPHTEADPAALLVSFLAAYGCAQHLAPHAYADGAEHPARLYAVIVGKSAMARKGTAQRNIERVIRAADPNLRILNGLSSGEGLIAAVGDGTEDKNGNIIGAVTDKRLLVVEPEFSRVLSASTRDGNTLSALIRQAYDSPDLRSMTKVPLVATGVHLSVVGHITAEEIRAKLTETDRANGFGNRFLYVCARRARLLPEGGNLDDAEVAHLAPRVRRALEAGRVRQRIRRSPEAVERWAEIYNEMAEDDPGGLLGAIVARADAHTLRLSLIYALLDGSQYIEVAHVDAAWALWRYCRASAAYIFGDTLGDEVADRLLVAIRGAGEQGLDQTGQSAALGRHVRGPRLDQARRQLIERGDVEERTAETGGRYRTLLVAKEAKQAKEGRR